ncbi:MAG: phosphoribosylformylglycinamidine synthase, partial [Lachnospiraceae bacterium]|nr:phosphoribosylformylglycinamidine synthase [Lachnospiraceae bacterium]
AEVQKGNAPTERKIQRLFRRPEVTRLIKKCNDFGAGGVSVAIGELADGLLVNLDKVPKKYAGLDGTEIAISESQERMAVVVDPKHVDEFMGYAKEENLESVCVAEVTESPRLVLMWRGKEIVNLSRAFLDTNGAHQETKVAVDMPSEEQKYFERKEVGDVREAWLSTLKDLNVCSQKGLVEMFDGSIGAGSVFMPYGGRYQLTETQTMVAKLPVLKGRTDTVTMMSYGFDPYLSSWSPYHGAVYAVLESVAKIVASGGDYRKIRFTFQEYFRRMTEDPHRWSQPFAALLGAYSAQLGFGLPSIGGKDSMSGSFNEIDVPPTLVSFAVDVASYRHLITPELKKTGNKLVLLKIDRDDYDLPDYGQAMDQYGKFFEDIKAGRIVSAYALDAHGIVAAVSKMAFGNRLGVKLEHSLDPRDAFAPAFGGIVAEVPDGKVGQLSITYTLIGEVTESGFSYGNASVTMEEALEAWTGTLEKVFPTKAVQNKELLDTPVYHTSSIYVCRHKVARPTVFIPVFPGTNCEYDSGKAFERAGADVVTKIFRNLSESDIRESVDVFEKAIAQAQIIMFPGGFSAGDEPDGSAKFFATAFQNEKIKEAVNNLLKERDGLILGICNGFQALVKLGLLPHGENVGQTPDSPTLTFNTINRHISRMVYTKVVTDKSPWLSGAKLGETYAIPVSHGEGRFVAPKEWIDRLFANGQVATQYVDLEGRPTMDEEWNVNGSYGSIEGILSPDGRVFGKMGHSERIGEAVAINIYGEQDMKIFESGVEYFR